MLSHSVTKLDQASPSIKKRPKLARHQSLGVYHNQTTNENDSNSSLTGISRKMLLMLAEKREKGKRPEALTVRVHYRGNTLHVDRIAVFIIDYNRKCTCTCVQ